MGSEVNNTMEQSFADNRLLKMYFVLKDNQELEDAPEIFQRAFQTSVEKLISPEWISESKLMKVKLNKKILCVLQNFEGKLFEQLRTQKCLILGPRTILSCLMKGEPTPDGPNPVFNLAMKGIIVCVSGFTNPQKMALQDKVEFMGGEFKRSLITEVTHLVTNKTTSEKYHAAAKMRIPVMLERWIHETWQESQKKNIHGQDAPLNLLRCPPFQNLQICTSQISKLKKERIKKLVESQGGVYCPNLVDNTTDVLVAGLASGIKVMSAKKWNIPCVQELWVDDSFNAGYALEYKDYEIQVDRCSTPEADKTFVDANFSMISCISSSNSAKHLINETITSEASFLEPDPVKQNAQHFVKKAKGLSVTNRTVQRKEADQHQKTPEKSLPARSQVPCISKETSIAETLKEIEKLDISDVKKAGRFLDGCKIYLSGFTTTLLDKVRKLLNFGGATRLDQITEGVSIVLVAGVGLSAEDQRAAMVTQANVVQAEWLLASMKQGHPANVEPFLCYESQQSTEPSPLSKKGLQMWRKTSPLNKTKNLNAQSDLHLVKQYIQFDPMSPEKTQSERTQMDIASSADKPDEQGDEVLAQPLEEEPEEAVEEVEDDGAPKLFSGFTLWSVGLEETETQQIKDYVLSVGGKWGKKDVDYLMVPLRGAQTTCQAKNVVTLSWIEDCISKQELVPIEYCHRPLVLKCDTKPLVNCVLAVSSYSAREKSFLSALAEELGALFQDVFAKNRAPDRNAEASTHLLCPIPSGPKYSAAVRWKLPVVTKEWLIACAEEQRHVPEEKFLLIGSVMIRNVPGTNLNATASTTCLSTSCVSSIATPDQKTRAGVLTAIPSRLLTPQVQSSPVAEPVVPADVTPKSSRKPTTTPNADKQFANQFKTPASVKGAPQMFTTPTADHSIQVTTPQTCRTPSQQYTPYTPASATQKETVRQKTPQTPAQNVDLSKLSPKSYQEYWNKKIPGHIRTPETPYGEVFEDNPSPNTRKEWKHYLNLLPDGDSPAGRKRAHDEEDAVSSSGDTKKQKQVESKDAANTPKAKGGNLSPHPPARFNSPGASALNNAVSPESPARNKFNKTLEDSTNIQKPKSQAKIKFMLSGIDESDRPTLENLVTSLGGEISPVSSFDLSATHLLVTKPVRSEKLLASIASGKWVVHHSFILESHKKGCFISEEEFEWGNPKATNLPCYRTDKLTAALSSACYRWRSKLQASHAKGAYVGMRAIVYAGMPEKTAAFSRLVKAGGGEVLNIKPPFSDPEDATHCLLDKKFDVDLAALERNNVVVLAPVYLNDFLVEDPPPSPQQWLIAKKSKNT